MPASLPLAIIILALALLIGLFVWRAYAGKAQASATPVAAANHKSVRFFSYAPRPAPEPEAAAPEPAANGALSRLMTEEEFKANEQKENSTEADRIEAQEAEARRQAAAQTAPAEPAAAAPRAVVSVAGLLSADDEPDGQPLAPRPEPNPATTAPADEDAVPPALFDNPLTAVAPTANDQENQRAAADLRRRKREALQARAAGEKTALTALYPGK